MGRNFASRVGKQVDIDLRTSREKAVGFRVGRVRSASNKRRMNRNEAGVSAQVALPAQQRFCLRFFGLSISDGLVIVEEGEMETANPFADVLDILWPTGAIAVRVIDHEGHFVFDRSRRDCMPTGTIEQV